MEKQDINTEHGGQMPGMDMSAGHGTMEHMQQTDMKDGHSKQMNMAGGHMMHMGNLRRKFWVSLVITIPILLLSPMMGMHTSFQITFPGSEWVVLALATFLFFYGGRPFLSGAAMELRMKRPAMMTLIAMGIAVSYVYSLYAFIANNLVHASGHKMDFFWELATLIVIMLLGHWIEMRAVGNAGNALQKMAELLPGSAHLVGADGETKDVPLQQVEVGQQVMVKPGEKVPADGTVVSGETTVNEAMVTGEAKDVEKKAGTRVIGGSINGNGTIVVKITGTGESGYLAQVMKLVGEAQQEKSRAESVSDKVAKALFYVALSAGIIAFVVWLIADGSLNIALERMVTVFIIACPHALGLAIPLVVARSTSLGAARGLLIRNRNALEKARRITVVTMDKTGTLTEGNFRVSAVQALTEGWNEARVLRVMAALETGSNHPLAASIIAEAKERGIPVPRVENVTLISGTGLIGVVDGVTVEIVTAAFLDRRKIPYDTELFARLAGEGNSVSFLVVEDTVVGLVAQGDRIKPEAEAVVAELQKEHVRPVMLTGDNEAAASAIAARLGITDVHASLLPENKDQVVIAYQQQGEKVMMVGDGVNDAPALARADIGVAIGAGTDVAIDSADVVLVRSNPYDIVTFLALAKSTTRKMVQNLWWGAGYNILAIPLAAGVLAPVGIILSPAVGAVLMSLSTVIVAINAMMLRVKK
ncbi:MULTISPECIES: heavy metal translocating P-type ATPase [Butyricimonas]|uniref:heavy metal translocating P-type ATPase n=1 Tax=Butyricimonas sp. DFI.6.44 TaxID=2908901 RepID=UPI001D06E122|nr:MULTISPECIES: heavy metal translocating P-type ATPase [Butyricimonas]MCB6971919.1 copper-translocating P-type ATPase [Butyricimonas synergistica]MCG4518927.1 copper-translocating P-type ATPase [Butyricimonas sp. DFI.6.44]